MAARRNRVTILIPIILFVCMQLFSDVSFARKVPDETVVYVTDTGECYHRSGCSYLQSSNRLSIKEAVQSGYRACSRCNPGVPAGDSESKSESKKGSDIKVETPPKEKEEPKELSDAERLAQEWEALKQRKAEEKRSAVYLAKHIGGLAQASKQMAQIRKYVQAVQSGKPISIAQMAGLAAPRLESAWEEEVKGKR